MESVVDNQLIFESILQFIPLRHKLRLRSLNGYFKEEIESWIRRSQRTLELSGPGPTRMSEEEIIRLINMVPQKLDVLVIDREYTQNLWNSLQERLENTKEIRF